MRTARLKSLTSIEADALRYVWQFWARPEQIIPAGDWKTWLILAGRGFGKTRTGAESVREWAQTYRFVNIIGPTSDDARSAMVEGESGLLSICPDDERPTYLAHKRELHWPNGAKTIVFSAEEPDRLRNKQHEKLWCDELAAWRYSETWDQAMFGLRLGTDPQVIVTTTPRPTPIVKEILRDPTTHVTRGDTYANRANLSARFFSTIIAKYEGTRLGRQELNAELLEDNPGALWQRALIDAKRVTQAPELRRIVVAVDPPVTNREDSDEAGIVAAGKGVDGEFYVLDDASLRASPEGWARKAVALYHDRRADRLVAEVNNGGDMVELTIRTVDRNVSYKGVHASRGKMIRAEPIAALYEQGRVHHVGSFPQLEDQMCDYDPLTSPFSPDRMDALVWALTDLSDTAGTGLMDYYTQLAAH